MVNKQRRAQVRNYTKMRIVGSHINKSGLTQKEKIIVKKIETLKKELIDNWEENSKILGFNVKKRCERCNNPVTKDSEYCKKHSIEVKEILKGEE